MSCLHQQLSFNVSQSSSFACTDIITVCAGGSGLGLPEDLLPNGMPALPADLQLDAPLSMPK